MDSFPLVQLGPEFPLTNATFAKLTAVLTARRNAERDRVIYHGICERIGDLTRFTGNVGAITDPGLKRRTLELLRDFNAIYTARIHAEIELAKIAAAVSGQNPPPSTPEESTHAAND